MKVIEQIDNRRFIVEVEDTDLAVGATEVTLQHDYFRIERNDYLYAADGDIVTHTDNKQYMIDGRPYGNTVPVKMQGTIGIREFQFVIENYFDEHPYLDKDHLVDEDDNPDYTWNDGPFSVYDGAFKAHHYFYREKDKIYEIPKSLFNVMSKRSIWDNLNDGE